MTLRELIETLEDIEDLNSDVSQIVVRWTDSDREGPIAVFASGNADVVTVWVVLENDL